MSVHRGGNLVLNFEEPLKYAINNNMRYVIEFCLKHTTSSIIYNNMHASSMTLQKDEEQQIKIFDYYYSKMYIDTIVN